METSTRSWNEILAPYKKADNKKALFQLANTAIPFAALWYLMYLSLDVSYFLTLLLAVPTAALLIRLFIFQHDAGHGSFFTSRRANDMLGSSIGVLMLTPYYYWRRTHALHHGGSGNLDRRGFGDVDTITVDEYLARSFWGRLGYRFYRHPIVMLGLGPIYVFLLKHRFPFDIPFSWRKEWRSVMLTNLALAVIAFVAHLTIGLVPLLLVQLPINLIAAVIGIWLFYVQHQFEETYWEGERHWDFHQAGIAGSSYFELPPALHWLTGNIGYHHIHHLASRIPNYRLRQCMDENPELQRVTRLTIGESFRCGRLKLWDEQNHRLISFRELARRAVPAGQPVQGLS